MRPSTETPLSTEQLTSTGTADVKTATIPAGTSGVILSVETTDARITLDGTTPGATNGLVFPKAVAPVFLPVGNGAKIKIAANSAASSILDIAYLA